MRIAHLQCIGFVLSVLLLPTCTFALSDDFAAPLSSDWSAPRTEEPGSSVTAPVADADAVDGQVLELLFPGGTSPEHAGPAWATELETAVPYGFGTYQARLRAPKASRSTGLVTAFFTYFNDGADHDMDGVVDNHEIDVELLAAEPSTVYMSVWTEYQDVGGVETFYKTTRKVDLRTGRVWETPPGGEGTYDLVEVAPLGWRAKKFRSWRAFATYRFEWSAGAVEYAIDLGDGQGFRVLWTLTGTPNDAIPSIPAPLLFNLWHNAAHWHSGKPSRVPKRDVVLHADSVSVD
jgi:hypothetical protein